MSHVFILYKNIIQILLIKRKKIDFRNHRKKKRRFYFSVMNKLLFSLKKLYGDFKMECLEAMIANITEFDSAYLELKAAGILDILIHK